MNIIKDILKSILILIIYILITGLTLSLLKYVYDNLPAITYTIDAIGCTLATLPNC